MKGVPQNEENSKHPSSGRRQDGWNRPARPMRCVIVNEEGKLLNLPLNKNATAWQSAIHGFQQIVGDVVVMCQQGEDLVGLNPKLAKQLGGAFTMRMQNDVISDFLKEHVECELTKVKRHAR